jgi:hypothetical protein
MAVLMTLNGFGCGHLVRATELCRWLRKAKDHPVIVHQGAYRYDLFPHIPGASIPALYRLPYATAELIANHIARYAFLSPLPVLLEDTHPAPVVWPRELTRFLLVRPTTFGYLQTLRRDHNGDYARIFVCDHPESPTWPYDEDQTAEILAWDRWLCIGPVFRQPRHANVQKLRKRYLIAPDEQVFLFSMGGGGERPGSGDGAEFARHSLAAAERIRERCKRPRLIWIRGPLSSATFRPPTEFEVIDEEADLPSFLKLARGAVIRPGFNLLWECVAAGTPFLPIIGTTYVEPVSERLIQMYRYGIDAKADIAEWFQPSWLRQFREATDRARTRFATRPAAAFSKAYTEALQDIRRAACAPLEQGRHADSDDSRCLRELERQVSSLSNAKRLLVRLDDVVVDDAIVSRVIHVFRERGLHLSLEVIPYLAQINGKALDRMDQDGLLEVSQHGFAHLPDEPSSTLRGEFTSDVKGRLAAATSALCCGIGLLKKKFGPRFKGGYSAPYDTLPPWLPEHWRSVGGKYLSWIASAPRYTRLAHVQIRVDPWDWRSNSPRTIEVVARDCVEGLQQRGFIGLVLHPQCLRDSEKRIALERIIDALVRGGCTGLPISQIALNRS